MDSVSLVKMSPALLYISGRDHCNSVSGMTISSSMLRQYPILALRQEAHDPRLDLSDLGLMDFSVVAM